MKFLSEHPQLIIVALLLIAAVVVLVMSRKNPALAGAMRRVFSKPQFMAAFILLVIAALGLNFAVDFMKLHFKKEPVPLARKLTLIGDKLGPWVQVNPDKAIDKEIEDVLGTNQYIFREYVDERIAGGDVRQRFARLLEQEDRATDPAERTKFQNQREEMLSQIRGKNPEAVVNLAVTYYTGMVDTVAHVPDRCYVADGYEPRPGEDVYVKWPIGHELPDGAKPKVDGKASDQLEVHYINFEDQTGTRKVTRSVAYFFHANGEFVSSPLGVRRKLQNLFERHGYYAKVEVMTLVSDADKSARVMTDFLTEALPDIYRSMPDWQKVAGSEAGPQLASAGSANR
ncbi:MAG TPA: exosortase-associated EpsI family protein [Tepidisphaeraceae bacterium]|jgi:hypothetical protein